MSQIIATINATISGSTSASKIPLAELAKLIPIETNHFVDFAGTTYEVETVVRKIEKVSPINQIEDDLYSAQTSRVIDSRS